MPPSPADLSLASALHKRGRLPEATLRAALAEAGPGRSLATVLVERGLVTAAELAGSSSDRLRVPAETEWRIGARVDRYELEKELGRGGMGVVYLARDVENGRQVAIKTLLAEAGTDALKRFAREGEAQAAVDEHPNVLRIRAAGEAHGRNFLVMDFAPGGDLARRLKQGPLPPLEAATIARDLARGLAHVHGLGVLHRDLKPANVLFDEDGTPRLVDFGLARLAGAEKLTATGAFLGTPAYMAPEQTGGERVDERADVYGLGAILYHMLTGRVPFPGDGVDVITKVLMEPPTPVRELVPEVPEPLERIVRMCLAKQPDARYPSAERLALDLDRALSGGEVEARAASSRRGLAAALVVAALALAGVGWAVDRTSRESPPSPPAPPPAAPPVAPPPPAAKGPLDAAAAYGLPTKGSRPYRVQWHEETANVALRHFLSTLDLGPAEGPDAEGVVRCRGSLSEMIVWAGAVDTSGLGNIEHSLGSATVELSITVTPSPVALTVKGYDARKLELLELIPEKERWNPTLDGGGRDELRTWTGSLLKHTFRDALFARVLGLSLPRVARDAHGLVPQRNGARDFLVKATTPDLLLEWQKEDLLAAGASLEGRWRLDADGVLERATITEENRAKSGEYPSPKGGATWEIGPKGSFRERRR